MVGNFGATLFSSFVVDDRTVDDREEKYNPIKTNSVMLGIEGRGMSYVINPITAAIGMEW
jgi:hypothetical protein